MNEQTSTLLSLFLCRKNKLRSPPRTTARRPSGVVHEPRKNELLEFRLLPCVAPVTEAELVYAAVEVIIGGEGLGFRCLRRIGQRWLAIHVVKERNDLGEEDEDEEQMWE